MKKTLFATAFAVAALASAPAFAQSVGYIGLGYSQTDVEIFDIEGDFDAVTFAGSVAAPLNDNLTLAFDGSVIDVEDSTIGAATIHLSDRLDSGLIGGFAGATKFLGQAMWGVGMEGEAYLDAITLGGSVAFASSSEDIDVDLRLYNVDGRYFVNDNLRLDAAFGYAEGDLEDADIAGWTTSVGAEYQLPAKPVSFFGAYTHTDVDDLELTTDTFAVGFRWAFGGTLKERDRAGGGLRGIDDLLGGMSILSLVDF